MKISPINPSVSFKSNFMSKGSIVNNEADKIITKFPVVCPLIVANALKAANIPANAFENKNMEISDKTDEEAKVHEDTDIIAQLGKNIFSDDPIYEDMKIIDKTGEKVFGVTVDEKGVARNKDGSLFTGQVHIAVKDSIAKIIFKYDNGIKHQENYLDSYGYATEIIDFDKETGVKTLRKTYFWGPKREDGTSVLMHTTDYYDKNENVIKSDPPTSTEPLTETIGWLIPGV